jgi:predicted amidohydrolase
LCDFTGKGDPVSTAREIRVVARTEISRIGLTASRILERNDVQLVDERRFSQCLDHQPAVARDSSRGGKEIWNEVKNSQLQ